ncbi:MAG TPA: hypothetical protein VHS81_02705, partial [Caulobacteraceae bacterium]|nr:hypothetical protein [Caulobacteraceae bacterium]
MWHCIGVFLQYSPALQAIPPNPPQDFPAADTDPDAASSARPATKASANAVVFDLIARAPQRVMTRGTVLHNHW